jgi:thioredoxin-dependent peroxiredoxin
MRTTFTLALVAALAITARADDQPMPKAGDKAPAVTLQATQISKVLPAKRDTGTLSLADLKGRNVVLFFYPRAMTPGCTKESCGFRDLAEQFAPDTVIIGISTDPLSKQEEFTKKEGLTFPLFADPELKATQAFGVLVPERKAAKRVTFVIDKQGVIRKVYTEVKPDKHPQEVLEFVKENLTGK